jgi:TRAP-type mannitol/chloroaromatic compound transport system permease small subunit
VFLNRKRLQQLTIIADKFGDVIGASVAWLTLAMVIVTCSVVLARYVFDYGSIALQESVMYMHGIVFMLGIAYTLKEKGHVRVDVLYERLSLTTQLIIDILGHLTFLLPFAIFILWTSSSYVEFAWSLRETSAQPGGLPGVFLVKTLIPIMAFLLLIQGLSEILKSVIKLMGDSPK